MKKMISLFLACIMQPVFDPYECYGYLNEYVIEQENSSWDEYELPDYRILIDWFPYDSDANKVANYWYEQSSWNLDMIATFIAENGWFDKLRVSKTNDYWLCQLHYNRTNAVRIDDPRWIEDIMFQAEVCMNKRNAVPNPAKVWYGWKNKEKTKQRIIFNY